MTTQAVREAAERIMADREFARRVYDAPDSDPPIGGYDLDPGEWQAMQRAVTADVETARGEVAGYSFSWDALDINFANVEAMADAAKGKGGKASFHDFNFVHHVDKASPL